MPQPFFFTRRARAPPPPVSFENPKLKTDWRMDYMRNFTDNGIAQNKKNKGIVYRFADGTRVEITENDYNAYITAHPARPGAKTPPDFATLKAASDEIYEQEDKSWNVGTKKNLSFDVLSATGSVYRYGAYEPSPETLFFDALDAPDEAKKQQRRKSVANDALDTLTAIQRRRYILHTANGMTTRRIADDEGVSQRTVMDSIEQAQKKIRKFLAKG